MFCFTESGEIYTMSGLDAVTEPNDAGPARQKLHAQAEGLQQ